MSTKKQLSLSTGQTKRIAARLAREILKRPASKQATIIALQGDLGSGKTTFIQGFAKGLGVKENITSPTFTIIKNYKLSTTNYKLLYHIDCYRIENEKEILDLGWQEIISNPKNIIAIEWPERIKKLLPKHTIQYELKVVDKDKREIKNI